MGFIQQQKVPLITTNPYIEAEESSDTFILEPKLSWRRKHTTGWRFGVLAGATCSSTVFLVNLGFFIWAESRNGFLGFKDDGRHALYKGSCDKTRNLNIGVHLIVNILSTILLSASNYCMQCLSAPTRGEVNEAHARKTWLDIGIQSMRNLTKIDGKRSALYLLLALSSLPLHLFYNSTVFSSIAASDYFVYTVNEAFADPKTQDFIGFVYPEYDDPVSVAQELFNKAKSGVLERLEPLQCLNAYAQTFQTARGSLLLVVPDSSEEFDEGNATQPTLWYKVHEAIASSDTNQCPPFEWICSNDGTPDCHTPCEYRLKLKRNNISTWKPFTKEVMYCLSEPIQEHCRLLYSVHLAVTVIILNAMKAIIMLYLAFGISESPLMTMGDAVSSFLRCPDSTTDGMCLVTRQDLKKSHRYGRGWSPSAKKYNAGLQSRFVSVSASRWLVCMALCTVAIAVCLGLLVYGVQHMKGPRDILTIFRLGLGAINPATFIRWELAKSGASAIILNVIVANSPQVVLSFIYFTYNGLFTSMSLATEWSQQSLHRKGLRVSSVPKGAQRSTYFLQLPYRFALPLMVTAGTLHWLVSQSIFLVSVEAYLHPDSEEQRAHVASEDDYMTCGYSPVAIIAVIGVGVLMVATALITGSKKLKSGMPIAASCSAAISAACHPEWRGDVSIIAVSRVQWGSISAAVEDVGHCTFSNGEVFPPEDGKLYAGVSRRQ